MEGVDELGGGDAYSAIDASEDTVIRHGVG